MKNFFLLVILLILIQPVIAQNTDSTVSPTPPPVVAPVPQEVQKPAPPPVQAPVQQEAPKTREPKETAGFRFGLKFSPNLTWIKPETKNVEKDGMRLGFSYGLMGDFKLSENYAVATELLISTIGGKVNFDSVVIPGTPPITITNVAYTYKLQYFQLPIALKMKTKEIGYITYWGQFGFAPSILLKSRADITSNPSVSTNPKDLEDKDVNEKKDEYVNFQDNINFFRVSLILAAGIEYNISGNTSVVVGLKFDNGFTDIFNDKNTKGINNYVALNAGLFF